MQAPKCDIFTRLISQRHERDSPPHETLLCGGVCAGAFRVYGAHPSLWGSLFSLLVLLLLLELLECMGLTLLSPEGAPEEEEEETEAEARRLYGALRELWNTLSILTHVSITWPSVLSAEVAMAEILPVWPLIGGTALIKCHYSPPTHKKKRFSIKNVSSCLAHLFQEGILV